MVQVVDDSLRHVERIRCRDADDFLDFFLIFFFGKRRFRDRRDDTTI